MTPATTRATLVGLLIGTGLATLAALGPLVSAITITVGVETQVGDAAGLPDARMLPAALEGVGAVALIFLLTRRPWGGIPQLIDDLGTRDGPIRIRIGPKSWDLARFPIGGP